MLGFHNVHIIWSWECTCRLHNWQPLWVFRWAFLPSFEDVPMRPSQSVFTLCLQANNLWLILWKKVFFPIFNQIREVDANFRLLAKLHGRSIDANNAFHTTKRCEKLQEKLKLVECINGIALFSMSDTKNRLIPPIEHWCSIVQNSHVDSTGKHLSPKSTFNALHEKWSTNIKVGGIQASSIGTLPPILPNLLRF
jgi:hypothetical protein